MSLQFPRNIKITPNSEAAASDSEIDCCHYYISLQTTTTI